MLQILTLLWNHDIVFKYKNLPSPVGLYVCNWRTPIFSSDHFSFVIFVTVRFAITSYWDLQIQVDSTGIMGCVVLLGCSFYYY